MPSPYCEGDSAVSRRGATDAPTLAAKVGGHDLRIVQQLRARAVEHDATVLDHVAVARELEGLPYVLLNQEDRQTFGVDGAQGAEDVLHDDRRQAHRRLVEQQQ